MEIHEWQRTERNTDFRIYTSKRETQLTHMLEAVHEKTQARKRREPFFYINYNFKSSLFEASVIEFRTGRAASIAMDNFIEPLLRGCKRYGAKTFIGLTDTAVVRIYPMSPKERPTEYVENLWNGINMDERTRDRE